LKVFDAKKQETFNPKNIGRLYLYILCNILREI